MKKSKKAFRSVVSGIMALTIASSYTFSGVLNAAVSGDVNNDGSVTAADYVAMVGYLVGRDVEITDADINSDGAVNVLDAVVLLDLILNGDNTNPPEDPPVESDEKTITLNGDSITVTGTGTTVNGSVVTITEPGVYAVTGKLNNGQIIVDVDKTVYPLEKVELSLEGTEITSLDNSPVYIASIDDECVITAKKGTDNIISDGTSYTNADEDSGAIYAKDDIKIKGKGNLIVNGNCSDGIVGKDSVKIFNGNITVNAADDGIRGKDSVKIGDADDTDFSNLSVTVNTPAGDGIKATNATETDKGKVIINGGTVTVKAFGDGIQGESDVKISGGTVDVYTYEGSGYTSGGNAFDGNANKMPTDLSAKGIKSAGTINIEGGTITVDSSDDAVHGAGNVNIIGGRLELRSADDAVHSDTDLTIGAGTATTFDDVMIYVPKCYEGIEGQNIIQNSGTVIVYSDDDGYNAAGGADGSGMTGPGGWNPGGGFGGGGNYAITLNGGFAYVSAADGDHDGFDSNGSITIDGAIAVSNGNEAFDCDGTKSFNSGTFVQLSGSGNGGMGGFPGRPGGGMGGTSGMTASFSSTVSAQKGDRITVSDSSGNIIVSFLAGKPASTVSVGSKTVTSGTVTVGGDVQNGTALPVIGDSQQVYVGK